jgi:hypothetical protein
MPKINLFEILCSVVVWVLRPFSIVLEMLCHDEVGERYPGFASGLALLILWAWCFFASDVFPLHVLMLAFVSRLIVHRVMAIRRRVGGGKYIHGRSCGRPLVGNFFPQLSEQLIRWMEPVALLLVSAILCLISFSLGSYLLCAGTAWLGIVIVRALSAYNHVLDLYDADPQAAELPMAGRYFEVITPAPAIKVSEEPGQVQNMPLTLPTVVAVPV